MGGEESEKIIRVSGDNLVIKVSPDEEQYRSKYLPDPTNLTDEKLVCTVCSAALDQDIHKGRTIFVHRLLHVLVCEGCFNFYGDGCFSTDEDGDDKYCRWCGQGGTLYLCSACNCAFCQKCVKQNLKASVVAELEKDDWKCYFCNPRPLFGCRTICWGAGELNKIGKEKEKERLRKQKERLEKVGAKKKEENGRSRKASTSSDDEVSSKKRKSRQSSDSSSPEVMPKKVKRSSRSLNGSISRGGRKRNDSESDDSEDNKYVRQSRSRNNRRSKKESNSSSSEDSNTKTKKRKSKIKKKKPKGTSDESSVEDKKKSKAKNRSKKKVESSDDSSDEKSTNKKKKLKKKKYNSTSEESDDNKKRANKSKQKKKTEASSDEDSDDDSNKKSTKKVKDEKDSKKKDVAKVEENKSKSDSKENKTTSHEDALVKKRIKLAIMWLGTALKDISELGNLIAVRAAKFSKKKINADNLKTYDDVLTTVAKLRQLINGVHSNYNHIEKTLDSQLKPWKILTGLEEPDNEKPAEKVTAPEVSVAEGQESDNKDEPNSSDNSQQKPAEEKKDKDDINDIKLQLSEEMVSPDEDSENDQSTRDAVAKASEVLDKDQESENNEVNKGGNETALSSSLSNDVCNQSLQQDNSQSEPDEVRSDESEADSKNKTPKKSGYKSLLGSSKKKDQDGEKSSVKDSNKSVVEDSDSEGVTEKDSNKSVVNDSDSEGVTGKDSNKSPVEDLDSDGGDELSKKLSTPNKSVKEDSSGESEEEPKKEKPKPLSKKGNIRKPSKEKRDSKAAAVRTAQSRPTPLLDSSSEETTELELFSKRVKDKWDLEEKTEEEMNLKTSLGIDSSGDSDAGLEPSENNKKVLKKKSEERKDTDNKVAKKKKMDKKNNDSSEKKKDKLKNDNSENDTSDDDKNKKRRPSKASKNGENSDITEKSKKNASKEGKTKKESSKKGKKKNKSKYDTSDGSESDADKKTRKGDKDGDIKKEISDDDESKECPLTLKKEDSENEEYSLEIKGQNKHSKNIKQKEEDDLILHEGLTKESKESASLSEIENAVLDKSKSGEIKIKFIGLDSTSEEESKLEVKKDSEDVSDKQAESEVETKSKEKSLKTKSERNKRRNKNVTLLDSSDDEQEIEEQAPVQTISSDDEQKESEKEDKDDGSVVLDSADSSDSEIIPSKKRKKKSSSESNASVVSDEDNEDKKKKKRKRIRCADSSNESSGSGDGKVKRSKKSSQGESPGKGGRKNIKKIKSKDDLADATKEAAEEEKERRKRIEERQKLFNQVFETKKTVVLDKLVLDFDLKEKQELISVNKDLVSKMKPHQAKGVKFMWDSCFESVSQLKKKKGSGCILAHCMGLGKTFQVISLVHTLLTHEDTEVRTVMVVCPLSTVLNWYNEFGKWLDGVEGSDDIEVFHLTKCKLNPERARELKRWQHNGGVMIIGYEMFRNLACETNKKVKGKVKKDLQESLIDPGADVVICDEGHMLKNEATALSKAMTRVRTLRRIVLTGTPMQNNLTEYHCMVQFVKPNLLGTKKEFLNRFVNPITNGQFVDSTEADVKVMKRRAHVLHKMLEGLVQRFDYNVLTPFLPPKHEYVISVCLSELQIKLYQHYLREYSQQSDNTKGGARLFQDWQALGRIWTHPRVLKLSTDKANWLREKKMMDDTDEEGSLKDFVVDGSEEDTSTPEETSDEGSSDDSRKGKKKAVRNRHKANTRATRSSTRNQAHLESEEEEKEGEEAGLEEAYTSNAWWHEFIENKDLDDVRHSGKLMLLFQILRECELIEDKVLVFSQSLFSLDLIEYFLDKIDSAAQEGVLDETLGNHQGTWSRGLDYFRLDGSTSSENRNIWCKAFNREDNPRARLFLISTRAGGLGINLTAANRVIIFDASWNPSHDVQSIFRVYRFGQKKPCYIYRFIAHGTMEEKVYDRQVAKQSISNRVVDEQQVHRHFSSNDLNELYSFTPPSKPEDKPIPALPTDVLLAELLSQFGNWIEKYHEHDSLLENVVEEELNEEERKLAWEDFENDKKRGFLPNPGTQGYGNNFTGANNISGAQIEYLRQQLKAKYPNKSENELNQILVYQVSIIMRQQQLVAAQALNQAGMSAAAVTPQQPFTGQNLTPEQLFKLQQQHQHQMQWMQQVQQMKQQQQQQQMKQQQLNSMQNSLQSLLQKPQQMSYQQQMMLQQQANLARVRMQQTMNQQPPSQAINFQAPKKKAASSVTITEIPEEPKKSNSET